MTYYTKTILDMYEKKIFLAFFILITIISCKKDLKNLDQEVNSILGDISYIEKYGNNPSIETDEKLRITTHLEYVEKLLRAAKISHLTPEQINKRSNVLNLLKEYRKKGIYPSNFDYLNSRRPCFIDKDGKICAVGYLIEKTAGRSVAEDINNKFKYAYLLEMNDEKIDTWFMSNGLTKLEGAMIQPTYYHEEVPRYVQYEEYKLLISDTFVHRNVDVMPEFPGGVVELNKFIKQNLNYPDSAKNAGIQGIVYTEFVVSFDGAIHDIKILKDIGGGCGKEAIRIIESMPKWKNGEHTFHEFNDYSITFKKAVSVRYYLPIEFSL